PGGVAGLEEYWQLLKSERDAVTEIPPERAAIGGGERGDAAVSGGARRYWMVFGDVGRPARRAAA
ncbi:hypothetical protein G5C37_11920, partial [Burkholderia pseudomallei]|uniref:hypothetical protein n=1 Tax=Burkholderia pseudomallei TaxID=28450 RepID=UPI00168BFB6B